MEYAFALERNRATNYSICGGRFKEGGVYLSRTNKLELYINLHQPVSPGASPAYFLIKYQGMFILWNAHGTKRIKENLEGNHNYLPSLNI